MDEQKMDQVLEALTNFIIRASKRQATAEEIAILPAVTQTVLNYWLTIRPR